MSRQAVTPIAKVAASVHYKQTQVKQNSVGNEANMSYEDSKAQQIAKEEPEHHE